MENKQLEASMHQAYQAQAEELVGTQNNYRKSGERKMGLEAEYSLVRAGDITCCQAERDAIVNGYSWLSPELGASQIELVTDPQPVNGRGFKNMVDQLVEREMIMTRNAYTAGLEIIRSGSNPLLPLASIVRTDKPKYLLVPDYYNQSRTAPDTRIGRKEQISIDDLSVVSVLNSVQVNLEAKSAEDGIDLLNRALMISPLIVAITANARYLGGKDTGLADHRMIAWSTAVDTRNNEERKKDLAVRVGLPDSYYKDLSDYLEKAGKYPFILNDPEHALAIAIGMHWRDARLKVIQDSFIVELRPVSLQPTIEDDIAGVLMYLGRLHWSQYQNEPLLPMRLVRENKNRVMSNGLNTNLWHLKRGELVSSEAQQLLREEFEKSRAGLALLGIDDEHIKLLKTLEKRISSGTPSDKMHRIVVGLERDGLSRDASLRESLSLVKKD